MELIPQAGAAQGDCQLRLGKGMKNQLLPSAPSKPRAAQKSVTQWDPPNKLQLGSEPLLGASVAGRLWPEVGRALAVPGRQDCHTTQPPAL